MTRFAFTLMVVLGLTGRLADADAPPIPPPTLPLVTAPHPHTHWEMTVEIVRGKDAAPAGAAATLPPKPATISCWLDASVGRVVVTAPDASQSEGYWVAGQVYYNAGGVATAIRVDPDADLVGAAYNLDAYVGTTWLTKEKYIGVEAIDKTPCYKFYRSAVNDPDHPLAESTVWISVADKTPVQVLRGNRLCHFSAIMPWKGTIDLPAAIGAKAKIVSQQAQALQALEQLNAAQNAQH